RMRVGSSWHVPILARWLLIAGLVLPVLALSSDTAMVRFAGEETTGPGPHSFFREIGLLVSFAVPLVLLGAGFVGHALRERSAGFAFTAGLIANLTLMAGYALAFVSPEGHLSGVHWVRLLHWGTAGAAFWALAWLASRRWVSTWRAGPD